MHPTTGNITLVHWTGAITITWSPAHARQHHYTPEFIDTAGRSYIKLGKHLTYALHITRDGNVITGKLTPVEPNTPLPPGNRLPTLSWRHLPQHAIPDHPPPIDLATLIPSD